MLNVYSLNTYIYSIWIILQYNVIDAKQSLQTIRHDSSQDLFPGGREDWWTRHPVDPTTEMCSGCPHIVHTVAMEFGVLWIYHLLFWSPFVASLLIPMEYHMSLGRSYWMPQDVCLIFRFYSMISPAIALVSVLFLKITTAPLLRVVEVVRLIVTETIAIYIYIHICKIMFTSFSFVLETLPDVVGIWKTLVSHDWGCLCSVAARRPWREIGGGRSRFNKYPEETMPMIRVTLECWCGWCWCRCWWLCFCCCCCCCWWWWWWCQSLWWWQSWWSWWLWCW